MRQRVAAAAGVVVVLADAGLPQIGRRDETLRALFTPRAVPAGTYSVWVTEEPIERVVELYRRASDPVGSPASWRVETIDARDAFGAAGRYDRRRVAMLYGGRRARVARGPIVRGGRVTHSLTLVSPHPDASLARLLPGTLIIVMRLPER